MTNYSASLSRVFHALADPTRRAVIQQLGHGSASVKELAKPFDMALPSFLKHISILEDCGLIESTKVGRVRTCQVRRKELTRAESWLSKQRELWEQRTDRLAQYAEMLSAKEESNDQV